MNEFFLTRRDGFQISVLYSPIDHPKALVQLVHGAWEHKERYKRLIQLLNENGYSVIIHDQRGHGKSVNEHHPRENRKDVDERIEDIFQISSYIKEQNPGKKLFLLGHSMGSRESRLYLRKHDERIDGLILTGAPNPQPAGRFGRFVSKLCYLKGGKHGHAKLCKKRSGLDDDLTKWLSYSPENIKKAQEDKEELTTFDNQGYGTRFRMAYELTKHKKFKGKNKELPILFACGKDDPVTGYEKGRQKSKVRLERAGYKNIKQNRYEKRRHEVLNEKDHAIVDKDILDFLSSHC